MPVYLGALALGLDDLDAGAGCAVLERLAGIES